MTFDNLSRGHVESVKWGPFVKGDILDSRAVGEALALYKPQALIHFAALAYVGESVEQPLSYYETNVGVCSTSSRPCVSTR